MSQLKEQPLEQLLCIDCFTVWMFHGGIILSVPLEEDLLGWGLWWNWESSIFTILCCILVYAAEGISAFKPLLLLNCPLAYLVQVQFDSHISETFCCSKYSFSQFWTVFPSFGREKLGKTGLSQFIPFQTAKTGFGREKPNPDFLFPGRRLCWTQLSGSDPISVPQPGAPFTNVV